VGNAITGSLIDDGKPVVAYTAVNRIGAVSPAARPIARMIPVKIAGAAIPSWNKKGRCLNPEGSIGAFILPGLLKAYKFTNRKEYLESAQKAFHFYMAEFRRDKATTAGALDSYCVDKESVYPFLYAALELFKITNQSQYLDDAEFGAWYLTTWMFHHSIPIPTETTLGRMHYDTFGATSVSVAHHHLDPWGARFFLLLMELSKLKNDHSWAERAQTLWNQSMIGVSDGTFTSHEIIWPEGAQNEASFNTWFGIRNDVSVWFVAWPTAFRLEMLRKDKNWDHFR
jgi:hypothetical protein